MEKLKYYIYIRKSNESEERQVLSIPAQKRELLALAKKKQLRVIGNPLEESMSAKEPGRPVFNEVFKKVCQGKADGIICWKLDRMARNPVDGGSIMYALGKRQIKEIVTPDRTYVGSGDDKLLMSIIFGMATKYSDDLSDNVKRGNREALASGYWPGKPKLGYLRDHKTNKLVPDPKRFTVMQRLWQLLLEGVRPLEVLKISRVELGLRTPVTKYSEGKPLSQSQFYRMLRDQFYIGIMVRAGESYSGTHQPMIAYEDFEQVQDMLNGETRSIVKTKRNGFTYRGFVICGRCGAAVTSKFTVNRHGTRYIHYYCCRKERKYRYCTEGAIQEKVLDEAVSGFLSEPLPPARWLKELLSDLSAFETNSLNDTKERKELLEKQLEEMQSDLDKERKLLVRSIISEDDYRRDKEKLVQKVQLLQEKLLGIDDPVELVEPHEQAAAWLKKAKTAFMDGTKDEKRRIVNTLTLNLKVRDKKVEVLAKKPYSYFYAWKDYCRTQAIKCS